MVGQIVGLEVHGDFTVEVESFERRAKAESADFYTCSLGPSKRFTEVRIMEIAWPYGDDVRPLNRYEEACSLPIPDDPLKEFEVFDRPACLRVWKVGMLIGLPEMAVLYFNEDVLPVSMLNQDIEA